METVEITEEAEAESRWVGGSVEKTRWRLGVGDSVWGVRCLLMRVGVFHAGVFQMCSVYGHVFLFRASGSPEGIIKPPGWWPVQTPRPHWDDTKEDKGGSMCCRHPTVTIANSECLPRCLDARPTSAQNC